MISRIEDYLARLAERWADLPEDERESRLAEVRPHLEEAFDRRRAAQPERSPDEVALAVVEEFGEPDEVAGSSRPRSATPWWKRPRVLALLGIGLAAILVIAVIAMVALEPPSTVYSRTAAIAGETGSFDDEFQVSSAYDQVDIYVNVTKSGPSGCAGVRIVAPDGSVPLDESANCAQVERYLSLSRSFEGTWKVHVTYSAFTGSVQILAVGQS